MTCCSDDYDDWDDETPYTNCLHCAGRLIDAEQEYGMCDDCFEVMVERDRKRREWREYHPGEPCPEIELPPMPERKLT
jgi:hypothetical protein